MSDQKHVEIKDYEKKPHKCDAQADLLMMTQARDLLKNICIDMGVQLAQNHHVCAEGKCPLCFIWHRLEDCGLTPPEFKFPENVGPG